jgi:hypothetical protein
VRKTITFCKRPRTKAKEIAMLQLQLLSLVRTEEELVTVEAAVRAELLALMARVLVTVFQAQEKEKDERASIQSKDQTEPLSPEGHRLLASVE